MAIFNVLPQNRIIDYEAEKTDDWKYPDVILMVYSDGSVFWPDDPIHGGKHLHRASVGKEKLEAALAEFKARNCFDDYSMNTPRTGPDAAVTKIYARYGEEAFYMTSWHPLIEDDTRKNPKAVATSRGAEALGERNRAEVLLSDAAEYRDFRANWSFITRKMLSFVPDERTSAPLPAKVIGIDKVAALFPRKP